MRQKKLRGFLVHKNRDYLLEPGEIGRVKEIIMKVVDWAKEVKKRVAKKKMKFSNELKVYNLIRQNYLTLKGIYEALGLNESKAIFIYRSNWQTF